MDKNYFHKKIYLYYFLLIIGFFSKLLPLESHNKFNGGSEHNCIEKKSDLFLEIYQKKDIHRSNKDSCLNKSLCRG